MRRLLIRSAGILCMLLIILGTMPQQTGDDSGLALWGTLLAGSLCACLFLARRRKQIEK